MSYDREYDDQEYGDQGYDDQGYDGYGEEESEYDESYQDGDIRGSQYTADDYDTDEGEGAEDSPSLYSGQPAEYYQPEYDPADFKDEHGSREANPARRRMITAMVLCLAFLLCIILAIVLFLVLRDNSAAPPPTPVPTPAPTKVPTAPYMLPTRQPAIGAPAYLPPTTFGPSVSAEPTAVPPPTDPPVADATLPPTSNPTANPTKSPAPTPGVPDELVIIPSADTYIQRGIGEIPEGESEPLQTFEPRGAEQVFLIQNTFVDPFDVEKNTDAFALLNFDLSLVPFSSIVNRVNTATLTLQRRLSERQPGVITYTIQRLPSLPIPIETLHAGFYTLPDYGLGNITFGVGPQDENVTIDVTPLFFGGVYEPADDDQALLLINDFGSEKESGDAFYAREVRGREPTLRLRFEIPEDPGTARR